MTRKKRPGTIYLLHFDQPLHHARHYLGWTRDLDKRLAKHAGGGGARLLAALLAAGIGWRLARTWKGDRNEERRLKRCKMAPRYCPICRAERREARGASTAHGKSTILGARCAPYATSPRTTSAA